MNSKEARAYLSYSENDENLDDFYENYLFIQKNFFREKPIVEKIFRSRISKIQLAQQAFKTLGIVENQFELQLVSIDFGENILVNFNQYYQCRNKIFQNIYLSKSLSELCVFAQELLDLEKKYANIWNLETIHVNTRQTVDPMSVLGDIKKMEEKGVISLKQINYEEIEEFPYFLAELNRLKQVNR